MKTTVRGFGSCATSWVRFLLTVCLAALPLGTALAAVTVTLTAPTNGAVFTAGSNITLSANASATQGYTVSKVEFFRGGTTLIGTDTSSPYSITWTNVPAGSYTLTAKATAIKKNSPDQTATSTAVSITVNALPTVSMTSPAGGAVFAAPGSMTLTATASDSDGSIQQVEFFHGGTNLIATVTSSPYTYDWSGVAAGSYSLTAKATDNLNGATTSSPVAVTVTNAPSVTLTSPANNATFSAPASVTLTATASDSDGSIQQVEVFHGGTDLNSTGTTSPYTYDWTNVGAGSYSLTAKATDNLGIATTSTPANITVTAGAPAGLYFIHPDHLNTPRAIYNDQQQLAWRWDQAEPFGNSPPDENPNGLGSFDLPLRLPGQYYDRETALHYNTRRDYDPSTGRYVESDPIGLKAGLNTYSYVVGNPLRYRDPLGLLVRGPGCSDDYWQQVQEAERKIQTKINASCGGCSDRNTGCIPCKYWTRLQQVLQSSVVSCSNVASPLGYCAQAPAPGSTVTMFPIAITPVCGCLQATVLHELLHNVGVGGDPTAHGEINFIERRCFGCAGDRGYPPYVPTPDVAD